MSDDKEELVQVRFDPPPPAPGFEEVDAAGLVANEPEIVLPDAEVARSLVPSYLTEDEWMALRLRCYCGEEMGPDDTGACPKCGRGMEDRHRPAEWGYTDGGVHL